MVSRTRTREMRRDAEAPKLSGITRAEALQLLAEVPLFRGLATEELMELFREVQHEQIRAKTLFHNQEEEGNVLYVLKRGRVSIYRVTPSGRKVVVMVLAAPATFGSMNALGVQMNGEFAETIEDSLLCTVGRPALERLIRRRPDVALRLLDQYGRRLLALEERLEEMAALTAQERLAAILLRLAGDDGTIRGLTQDDLADVSGTVRQTVARILGAWRERGIIAVGRRTIHLLRKNALSALASADRSVART
jgi:CRP-like cAMP-binding protein